MRILFFIGGLTTGGAERQISLLADGLAHQGHKVTVVTIYPGGQYWTWLQNRGSTKLLSLFNKKPNKAVFTFWQLSWSAVKLRRIILSTKVSLVYSALNLCNFIAWFSVLGLSHVNLIWGIRASSTTMSWKDSLPFHASGFLSLSVPLLISNSYAGLKYSEDNRYKAKSHVVISNGIDTELYKFNQKSRDHLRNEWCIPKKVVLIGIVGRLTQMKDHATFLKAASLIAKERNDVLFVCVGDGKEAYRVELLRLTKDLGLSDKVIWAGERTDVHNVYCALDIAVSSSSYGEGFSNTVSEAMACGVPCVVTDVGDSARIVDDTGLVVDVKNPTQLADACLRVAEFSDDHRKAIGVKARTRIENKFSVSATVTATEKAMLSLSDNAN